MINVSQRLLTALVAAVVILGLCVAFMVGENRAKPSYSSSTHHYTKHHYSRSYKP